MKRFIAFVRKELYHILRDVRTLILLFVIPVVLVLLFGFAISTEINDAQVGILDKSNDIATRVLTDKLVSTGYFQIHSVLRTTHELDEAFRRGDIKIAVVFPDNFYQKLRKHNQANIQIVADASDPNTANILRSYMTAIIRDYQSDLSPQTSTTPPVRASVRMLYNPGLESTFYFVPGVITVIITLVCAMMTSVTVAREKEHGTMEILLVSPVKPLVVILGKSVPYMVLGIINALTILLLGYFVFEMPVTGNLILLIAECFLFVMTALSLGLFISTQVQTQRVALMISLIGLFLPTMLLSGFIFPIESMPQPLQVISNIVPAKWFIIILKHIMLKGSGLTLLWKETLILTCMTLVFLVLSIKRFRIRLE